MISLLWINKAKLLQAALAYADLGWPVIPLATKSKVPLTKHGVLDSATNQEQINDWWKEFPTANIGLRTGVVFDVLDLDGATARGAMMRIAPRYRHAGPISSTGKGLHYLFKSSGSRNSTRLADTTLDWRGDNGYIVAPPSVHPNGHQYKWVTDTSFLPYIPDWLHSLVAPTPIPGNVARANDPIISAKLRALPDIVTMFEDMASGKLHRSGTMYKTNCFWHPDDIASLVIYPLTNSFYCFACGAFGDPLNVKRWKETGKLR